MTATEPRLESHLKIVPDTSPESSPGASLDRSNDVDEVSSKTLLTDKQIVAPESEEDLVALPDEPITVDAGKPPVGEGTSLAIDPKFWADVDWGDLVPRLLLLALSRLSRMTWRGQRDAVPPGAAEAQDFVNDAIAKTLSGVRVWSKDKCSLFQHLAGVIVSDISHAAETSENKLLLAADGRGERFDDWPPDRVDDVPDQEQRMLWRSEQLRLLGHLDEVDPKLAQMAELILLEDVDGSAELAMRLDCTTNDIANLRKRLKRALRVYMLAVEEPKL